MSVVRWPCGCTVPIENPDYPQDIVDVDFFGPKPLGIKLDIYNINLKCEKVWDMLSDGKSRGVFQLESNLGRKWSKELKPRSVEEMGALGALLRPGCLHATSQMEGEKEGKSMTQRYCDRKHGLEDIIYIHPLLQPILEKTQGVLVFQEQAMKLAVALAGFNKQEADILRKAIGKKDAEIMAQVKENFLTKAKAAGLVPMDIAEQVFAWIQESQRYSFNKSHADAYAKNGYWSAWCKTHAPLQFYCSWLRGAAWKADKQQEEIFDLVNDAKTNGIEVCLPNIADKKDLFYIKEDKIYFDLTSIKGIGETTVSKAIVNLKKTEKELGAEVKDWSWIHYLVFATDYISCDVTESMIKAGALDLFGVPRNEMVFEHSVWNKLTKTEFKWIRENYAISAWPNLKSMLTDCKVRRVMKNKIQVEGGGCATQKRSEFVSDLLSVLTKPPHSLEDTSDEIAWNEQRALGVSLTCTMVSGRQDADQANCTCKEFLTGRSDSFMKLAVEIIRIKNVKTKKGKNPGQDMAFLTIKDESCALDDVACFPDVWKKSRDAMYEGNTILIQAERGRQDSLIIQRVWQI